MKDKRFVIVALSKVFPQKVLCLVVVHVIRIKMTKNVILVITNTVNTHASYCKLLIRDIPHTKRYP